jgi:Mce-associated membrane protein
MMEEPVASKADAMALIEQAEAEAAEAEALAAAARARARAARLRREALALAEGAEDYGDAAAAAADAEPVDYDDEPGAAVAGEPAVEDYYDAAGPDEFAEGSAPEPETEPAPRRWLPSMSAASKIAAVILIGCFAAASALMVLHHRDATQHQQRQAAFAAGAKQCVMNMISLDFSNARADVQRVIDSATGQFKDDFQQRADDLVSVVEQSKAVTEGTVNAAAVESMKQNAAVVLVSATSRVTNSPAGKDEPPKIWRLRVTIDDVGGQYKMSKVEYVT